MTLTTLDRAHRFRSLHDPRRPLLLSTVWDVASALVAEDAGTPALATTSAGIAWSRGVADGDHLGRAEVLAVVAAVAAAVDIPVSADLEGGYAETSAGVSETVRGVVQAGAVGINLEDGSRSPEETGRRVAAARVAADDEGVPLFVNARCDVYLRGLVEPGARLGETVRRAARYVDAGADGIFVPGVVDPETITALADSLQVPLNVMVGPGAPAPAELSRLGVARASLGSAVAQAAYTAVRRATADLLHGGTYDSLAGALGYAEVDGLLHAAAAHGEARTGHPGGGR